MLPNYTSKMCACVCVLYVSGWVDVGAGGVKNGWMGEKGEWGDR